jgi:hypothetical protein
VLLEKKQVRELKSGLIKTNVQRFDSLDMSVWRTTWARPADPATEYSISKPGISIGK